MTLTTNAEIRTRDDLISILPLHLADRVTTELLRDSWCAAALRILVTIKDPRWHDAVKAVRIDWDALAALADSGSMSRSAASRLGAVLALGWRRATHVDLFDLCVGLDADNFPAFMDALRIAREGLAP